MMAPPSDISGIPCRTQLVTVEKFSRIRVCSPLGEVSSKRARKVPPALLTSTSIGPRSSCVRCMKAATASSSRASSTPDTQRRPSASTCWTTSGSSVGSLSKTATSAPKRAMASAVAAPMPRAAPVTTATRSVSRMLSGEGLTDLLSIVATMATILRYRGR